jgi:pyruvate dehydrogenase E1 component
LMYYREDKKGQILEEGINEGGAFCSWIAAATSYANNGVPMIPFYVYYSMFGFQRIGDFAWAAGDMQARGFLIGGTAGRTTLAGEGLQHQDGHSHLLSSTIPNCVSYDPAYSFEVAVIVHDGLRRMYVEQENVFYYITTMNENYVHPAMPEGSAEGILKGMYKLRAVADAKIQLLGSGTILREVEAAADYLAEHYSIAANVWSVTSYSELRRDGIECERWNTRNPEQPARQPFVARSLASEQGPFLAASDYMRIVPDQVRQWVPGDFHVLGTDGFGRSDSRRALREHFEVNRNNIVVAALKSLANQGVIDVAVVSKAIEELGLDPTKPNPVNC